MDYCFLTLRDILVFEVIEAYSKEVVPTDSRHDFTFLSNMTILSSCPQFQHRPLHFKLVTSNSLSYNRLYPDAFSTVLKKLSTIFKMFGDKLNNPVSEKRFFKRGLDKK